MKYMMIACVVSLAILGCGAEDSAVRTDTTARPEKWAVPMTCAGVPNLHKVSDKLYRSAQPTAEQVGARPARSLNAWPNAGISVLVE